MSNEYVNLQRRDTNSILMLIKSSKKKKNQY
jgi:hypothetical protein